MKIGRLTGQIFLLLLVGLSFVPQSILAAKNNLRYPIRGIWFTDTNEGRAQCRNYLFAVRNKPGDAPLYLVGSQIINGNLWHSYSDYGEGNFYELVSLRKVGSHRWRATTRVGIDTLPDATSEATLMFDLSLRRGKLIQRILPAENRPRSESRFAFCAAVSTMSNKPS